MTSSTAGTKRIAWASLKLDDDPEGISRMLRAGLMIVVAFIMGVGGWASQAQMSGAVLAQGIVVVDSNVKKVQHPTGGVVGEIRVKDGDRVELGDIVMRLDETITRANLQIIVKQLNEVAVRQVRLKAERDSVEDYAIPTTLQGRQHEPEIYELIASEFKLFEARRASRIGQKNQLRERIGQLNEEVGGLAVQLKAKSLELTLVGTELEGQKQLWDKKLIAITKYTAMQREAARLDGEQGQLIAQAAQVRGKISEIGLQIQQIDRDLQTEAMKELRDLQAKESELLERRVTAEDQLRRVDVRATQSGHVHQLAVHTIGGVVTPSEPIMLIVPDNDALVIEARISPSDIDHVLLGQLSVIRFPAFNQRTTPEVFGTVVRIAADLTREQQQSSAAFFVIRIALDNSEREKLGTLKLIPGMPAEVHISTGDRNMISYLVKPLMDQFAVTFRER